MSDYRDAAPQEWPKWETCIHDTPLNKPCVYCFMDGELQEHLSVHWLAAKMAEPTELLCERVHGSGGLNAVAQSSVTAGETAPSWDTLHRTQDGLPPDRPTWDSLDRLPDGGYTKLPRFDGEISDVQVRIGGFELVPASGSGRAEISIEEGFVGVCLGCGADVTAEINTNEDFACECGEAKRSGDVLYSVHAKQAPNPYGSISTEPEPDAKADIWKAIEDSCKR